MCNLGGTFPRFFILRLVDTFTKATCFPGPAGQTGLEAPLITEPFSCTLQPEREMCVAGGGSCEVLKDGYYFVNMLCVVFGAVTFFMYIRPKVLQLQSLPLKAWRLKETR